MRVVCWASAAEAEATNRTQLKKRIEPLRPIL
jgi:hypothetical protein